MNWVTGASYNNGEIVIYKNTAYRLNLTIKKIILYVQIINVLRQYMVFHYYHLIITKTKFIKIIINF